MRKDFFVLFALAASLALNVYLGTKLVSIERAPSGFPELFEGSVIPSLSARDANGDRVMIDFSKVSVPTVLYVFTPPCKWCTRNFQSIVTLSEAKRGDYRFIGISLSDVGLREYCTTHQYGFPVVTDLPPDLVSRMGLGATPQTIVVSRESRVLKNWVGAYKGGVQRDVESFFGARLPGVTVEPPQH